MLKDTEIQNFYSSGDGDENYMADNFFRPAYENSIELKRFTGFFKIAVLEISHMSLEKFLSNVEQADGKEAAIQIIVDREGVLRHEADIADQAYKEREKLSIEEELDFSINEFLKDNARLDRIKLFSYLIKHNILDIKITDFKEGQKITNLATMHSKLGIFFDGEDHMSFIGGVNATHQGVANWDNFDVNRGWIGSLDTNDKIGKHKNVFNDVWNNKDKKLNTYTLPDAIRRKLIKNSPTTKEAKRIMSRNNRKKVDKKIEENGLEKARKDLWNKLKDHQKDAIDKIWKENKKAVLEYCTGSGKTWIALYAVLLMLIDNKKPIIIVPSLLLQEQWEKEIREIFPYDVRLLLCSSKNKNYHKQVFGYSSDDNKKSIIITTVQTARGDRFKKQFKGGDHSFLVVDECHTLWANKNNSILTDIPWNNCPRLALSATPQDTTFRDNVDESGREEFEEDNFENIVSTSENNKANVMEFFGGKYKDGKWISNDIFPLGKAIEKGVLSEYDYSIRVSTLDEDEMEEYSRLSRFLGPLIAKLSSGQSLTRDERENFNIWSNQRRRIMNDSRDKIQRYLAIMSEHSKKLHDNHWLIYVGDTIENKDTDDELKNIQKIQQMTKDKLKGELDVNYDDWQYYQAKSPEQRKSILKEFSYKGGIIFAIQMLDEGIDIPQLSHAVILSSSRNKRQYIQRRGRLLRINKANRLRKSIYASIWDILVVPDLSIASDDAKLNSYKHHLGKEFERASEFAKDSRHKESVLHEIEQLRIRYIGEDNNG